jgi:hypothetical protein
MALAVQLEQAGQSAGTEVLELFWVYRYLA